MSEQLIFNFPFKKNYLKQDFYVSKNNFNAYKLIESWPKWPSRLINIFGPTGCGKTYMVSKLSKIIDTPFLTVDATSFTSAGYEGRSVEEIVTDLIFICEDNQKKAEKSIVYIDEVS